MSAETAGTTADAVVADVSQTPTPPLSDDIVDNYWQVFVERVYAAEEHEKLPIASDLLHTLLFKCEQSSEHLLEHEPEYESFYTAIVAFASLQLLEHLDSCNLNTFFCSFFY